MRTGRSLSVFRGCTWSRGGVPGPGGGYLVLGGTWFGGYLVPGGCTWSQGGTWSRGVPGPGGPGPRGIVPGRGVYLVLRGAPGPGGCAWSQGVHLVLGGVCQVPPHPPGTRPGTPPPGPDQVHPLLTESQTGVKILPWPNFVAAGKYEDWL